MLYTSTQKGHICLHVDTGNYFKLDWMNNNFETKFSKTYKKRFFLLFTRSNQKLKYNTSPNILMKKIEALCTPAQIHTKRIIDFNTIAIKYTTVVNRFIKYVLIY